MIVGIVIGICLITNLGYAVDAIANDRIQVLLLPGNQVQEVIERVPGTYLIREQPDIIVGVPDGEDSAYFRKLHADKAVYSTLPVAQFPRIDLSVFGEVLKRQLQLYMDGDFGKVLYASKEVPVTEYLPEMITRTFSYLIPGFLLALVAGVGTALMAVLKPKIGMVFDFLNRVMLGLPDFFLIVMIQFAVILIDRNAGRTVILAMQSQEQTPLLIPMLGIAILPAVLIYGNLRIAFERELQEAYIKTAYSKGLSRSMIIFVHVFRNILEDLLSILPRAVTIAVTSMVVAEVMTGTFGLGGYAFAQSVQGVTSLVTTCSILAIFTIGVNTLIMLIRRTWVRTNKEVV